MVWFWKKKKPAAATADGSATASGTDAMAAQAEAAVQAAVADAQRSDKEWRRQAARLRDQEKRAEKERERAAKRELALMEKQARAARKERRQAEKRAQKQAKAVLKVHLREQKAERKRVKTLAKLRQRREKRDRKLLRRRQKEERRRRRRARAEDQARVAAAATAEDSQPTSTALEPAAIGVPLGVAPSFKEDARCKSCSSQFQRLPTRRRHHCRNCGESFCSKCLSRVKRPIPWFKLDKPQKVCFSCDVQVFNGMGGAARLTRSVSNDTTAPSTPPAPVTPGVEIGQGVQQPDETSYRRSPLRAQRSASFQSEQPEDSPRTVSPAGSRSGLSFRLRPRSRRDASSSKSKKGGSIWTLPIRPLLKRKASADQLRNRSWDLDLRIEKEEMLARQRQALMVVPTRAPQFATAS